MSTQLALGLPASEQNSASAARAFWRNAPLFFAILGVFLSLRLWIVYRGLGVSISIGDAIGSGFMECAVWLPFVGLSLWIAHHLRASNWSAAVSFAVHLVMGGLVSLGHLSAFAVVSSAFRSLRFDDAFSVNLWSPLFLMFVPGVFFYGLIVVGAWWLSERESRSETDSASRVEVPEASLELRVGRGKLLLQASEIDWIQAAGNYLELHGKSGTHLVRETLSSLADRLGSEDFLRVHRSRVVRRAAIAGIEDRNRTEVILYDGTRLAVGKTYRDGLIRCVGTVRAASRPVAKSTLR